MQFTDSFGVGMPQVTLPAPLPLAQFGTALDQARSQTFALGLGIGCGTSRHGRVRIVVEAADDRGRQMSDQISVDVR